jgi:hypothetical protein
MPGFSEGRKADLANKKREEIITRRVFTLLVTSPHLHFSTAARFYVLTTTISLLCASVDTCLAFN